MSATANLQTAKIGIGGSNVRRRAAAARTRRIGSPMVDVRELYKETGTCAYDPGLGETGICRSAITYVDGDNGVLLYRGYPIDALVEHCELPRESAWLLLNGELPSGSAARANSPTTSPITRWSTSNCTRSIAGSGATPTRWR